MDYDKAIGALTDWAQGDDNVRAMVMTGSAAADETHALSDRDIEVYAIDAVPLLADDSWWEQLGDVLVVERLANPDWHPARLVYYVGGKLDLTVIRTDALETIHRERPFTVLMDKDGLCRSLLQTAAGNPLPDEAAFDERLNWGYAAALMCAKAIIRDEPWSAKVRDSDLKASLLMLIEWDHRVRHGLEYDVRFLGSRMRQWMDADVQQALEQCWGHFDAADSAAALRASIALFAELGTRIAGGLGFQAFDHERVGREVESILAMQGSGRWSRVAEAYRESFASLCAGPANVLVADTMGPMHLDVGCGTGVLAGLAARAGRRVTAVDADPGMVAITREATQGLDVTAIEATLPDLGLPGASFDTATANFVLNHVADPRAAARELARVVRPGGLIAATVWTSRPTAQTELFSQSLAAAGAAPVPQLRLEPVLEFDRTVDGLAGLLEEAGCDILARRELTWDWNVAWESLWTGVSGGVAGIGAAYLAQTEEVRAAIEEEMRSRAQALEVDGLISLPSIAAYVLARTT